MNILLPKIITASMFGAGTTIPEVDSAIGEVAWVSGLDYALKDRRIWGGCTYECVKAIVGAPVNMVEPGTAAAAGYWEKDENAPSNRMAPFDKYLFTKSRRKGSFTYVLKPGFVNGLAIYGIEADSLNIRVRAGGVDLIPPIQADLWQQAFGEWEYLFGDLQRGSYYTLKNLPIHPDIEIEITVSRTDLEADAAIGYISVGSWKKFLLSGDTKMGGTQYGVAASTRDYSYVEDRKDGTYKEIPGRLATNITLTCVIAAVQAPAAKAVLDQILGKVVAVEVDELPQYGHLATVGKVTGSVTSISWLDAQVEFQIKGNV